MKQLEPVEFRSPIAELEFSNGRKVQLLFSGVWQRRFKALWDFIACVSLSTTLDFPNTLAGLSTELTVAVPGVTPGNFVQVAPPPELVFAGTLFSGVVSAANVVTVTFFNLSVAAINPDAGVFNIRVVS